MKKNRWRDSNATSAAKSFQIRQRRLRPATMSASAWLCVKPAVRSATNRSRPRVLRTIGVSAGREGGPKSVTWAEAKKAFEDNASVDYLNRTICRTPIECPRIAEITLHRREDGRIVQIVGAMDKNMNCIYRDTPDKFTRRT